MKGDFSRITFDKTKNYTGVLKQQGRVALDADWNEQVDIIAHQRQTRTADIIGLCGAPMHTSGFEIRHPGNGLKDLLISTGRFYIDGLLCELYPCSQITVTFPAGTTNQVQVTELEIDGEKLEKNQWVKICTRQNPKGIVAKITNIKSTTKTLTLSEDISSLHDGTSPCLRRMMLYSQQQNFPCAPVCDPEDKRTDLIYLDLWERHITAIEEPGIREIAIGGPDTATRTQTVTQVKILPGVGNVSCPKNIPKWNKITALSGGRLKTQTQAETKPQDPCLIAEDSGYRGLENRLYRVEIHEEGDLGTATFKWSRDNGSVANEIIEFIPDVADTTKYHKIRLKLLGRDQVLKIKKDDWLEISGDVTDLDVNKAGTIVKVTEVDEAQRILTLSEDIALHKDEAHPKIRRWDTAKPDTLTAPMSTTAGPIDLEDGIQIRFSGSNFKVGDYWIFAARTNTGKIDELDFEPPRGIKHHYCKLALVTWKADGTAEIQDCRKVFPSVTELTSLFYVSGDGQEAMPGERLPQPLRVGVANGGWPVAGAYVRFEIQAGNGSLSRNTVVTDSSGLAGCEWTLGTQPHSQQVKAILLDAADREMHIPIYFNANLSEASQVYYNPQACTKLGSVRTVQQAIDALCQLERGGGCAVTVGKGGEYERLDQAIYALIEGGRTDICICMLPGDHELPDGLNIMNKEYLIILKIVGCGHGTRLKVGERPLNLEGLFSFTLRDIEISAASQELPLIICNQCKEVTLESCYFWGITSKDALLQIAGAERIRLGNNEIEALSAISLDLPSSIFDGTMISALFRRIFRRQDFNRAALEIARGLSQFDETQRKDLAARVQMFLKELANQLSTAEQKAYIEFVTAVSASNVNEKFLIDSLKNIRDTAVHNSPGTAIALLDGNADTMIENNIIFGIVCLYGLPAGNTILPADLLKSLRNLIKENRILISGSKDLHVRDNRLTRLVISEALIEEISSFRGSEGGELKCLYRNNLLTNNVFEIENNFFLAQHLTLTSNTFTMAGWAPPAIVTHVPTCRVAIGFSNLIIFTGNNATYPGSAVLENISMKSAEAANFIQIQDS